VEEKEKEKKEKKKKEKNRKQALNTKRRTTRQSQVGA